MLGEVISKKFSKILILIDKRLFYQCHASAIFSKNFPIIAEILTEDQLRLLKYDNVLSGKYKSNFEIGIPSKRYFNDEVRKYSYMWREGGQFSTEKYLEK